MHTIKVTLPVGTSYSTLSLGFAITFASLLVLGPAATVWTMIVGGWAQCTINVKTPNPWYRTAFSMSALSPQFVLPSNGALPVATTSVPFEGSTAAPLRDQIAESLASHELGVMIA